MYIDCLIEISSSVNDLNHKPDSVTQVYFLLGKKKELPAFSVPTPVLGFFVRYLFLTFSPCKNDRKFGCGFHVL